MAICAYCGKEELTIEEAKHPKKMCMFCIIDGAFEMKKATGFNVPLPKPFEYGRSKDEFNDYVSNKQNQRKGNKRAIKDQLQDALTEIDLGKSNPSEVKRPGEKPDFADDEIGRLLKSYDPNEPPTEFYFGLSDDFFIKACIPGPISDKAHKIYSKIIRKVFTDMVYQKISGSYLEYFYRDPDEPQQGGHQVFP